MLQHGVPAKKAVCSSQGREAPRAVSESPVIFRDSHRGVFDAASTEAAGGPLQIEGPVSMQTFA